MNHTTPHTTKAWQDQLEGHRARSWSHLIDRVVVVDATPSTQDLAYKNHTQHQRVLALARKQTCGRGRLGRRWIDQPDNSLSMSMGLCLSQSQQACISLTAAVAVAQAAAMLLEQHMSAESAKKAIAIRWPNDIMAGGSHPTNARVSRSGCWRKLAGILIEQHDELTILGIGLNLNHSSGDWPGELQAHAVSLAQIAKNHLTETGIGLAGLFSPVCAAKAVMDSLCHWLNRSNSEVVDAYLARDMLIGTHQRFLSNNNHFEGHVEAIDPTNTITIRDASGSRINLPARSTSLIHEVQSLNG